jgi:hypothetical protein
MRADLPENKSVFGNVLYCVYLFISLSVLTAEFEAKTTSKCLTLKMLDLTARNTQRTETLRVPRAFTNPSWNKHEVLLPQTQRPPSLDCTAVRISPVHSLTSHFF